MMFHLEKIPRLTARDLLVCRGCLGPLDGASEAGLCGRCWSGLVALPEGRCPRCALLHGEEEACPEPVAWAHGDALWDYHGGRPALGALLVPGIKGGDHGWKSALEARLRRADLPAFTTGVDLVVPAPTSRWKLWLRGFDLGADLGALVAARLERPLVRALARGFWRRGQTGRTESQRRRLPRKAILLGAGVPLRGRTVLLVDDVWTTGTTLLRCAERLAEAGVREVRVLTAFRAM